MSSDYLKRLNRLTKAQLIQVLQTYVDAFGGVYLPREFTGHRGRRDVSEIAYKLNRLREILQAGYPDNPPAINDLAEQTGLAVPTLYRWRTKPTGLVLTVLGQQYYDFFRECFGEVQQRVRLSPWVRAAFMLHYYWLAQQHPGYKIPFVEVHSAVFGHPNTGKESRYRTTLFKKGFASFLKRVAWPPLQPMVHRLTAPQVKCFGGCPLLALWMNDPTLQRFINVGELRLAIGGLPYGVYTSQVGVVNQVYTFEQALFIIAGEDKEA